MSDLLLGRKLSEKDLTKAMPCLTPALLFGEAVVCAIRASGSKPFIDLLIVTNKRLITLTRVGSGSVEVVVPIEEVQRLLIDGSKVLFRTQSGDLVELCSLVHGSEDASLLRRVFTSISSQIDTQGGTHHDPTEAVVASPRSKAKNLQNAYQQIDAYLEDGERILYALQEFNDIYFVTDRRVLVLTGIVKSKVAALMMDQYVRVAVEKQGTSWVVAAADHQQNYGLIGKLAHEGEAQWLARSIESAFPHMHDRWRDSVREFVTSMGLSYALEAVFPLMWPGEESERIISGFGSGENVLIFTSHRVVALPDVVAAPGKSVVDVSFSVGRSEHYSHSGQLLQLAFGSLCEVRLKDGRRFGRLMHLGNSQQEFNASIPWVTSLAEELEAAGYPVSQGEEWVEQTQNPPPAQGRGGSSVGFSVEF